MKLKYKCIIGGVYKGILLATFPFGMFCYNNENIKIKIFLITIFKVYKNEVKNIQKIDDDIIKITTIQSREILFGCFKIDKLIDGLREKGFIVS